MQQAGRDGRQPYSSAGSRARAQALWQLALAGGWSWNRSGCCGVEQSSDLLWVMWRTCVNTCSTRCADALQPKSCSKTHHESTTTELAAHDALVDGPKSRLQAGQLGGGGITAQPARAAAAGRCRQLRKCNKIKNSNQLVLTGGKLQLREDSRAAANLPAGAAATGGGHCCAWRPGRRSRCQLRLIA